MEVDLRAVECAVSFVDDVLESAMLQCTLQRIRRLLPHLIRAHRVVWTRREFRHVREAKRLIDLIEEIDRVLNLLFDLIRRYKEMRVILREVADAEETVQLPRLFVAMDESELAKAKRQIAIAVLLGIVNEHAPRTIHWLYRIVLAVNLREVHVLFVVRPVPRLFPNPSIQYDRRANLLIAVAAMYLTPVIDELVANDHAVRMKERESRAFLVQAE